MKTRTKQYLAVLVIVALAVAVYTGSVFAQDSSPSTPTNMLQWMQERLGPEAWAQRVERMTQIHGAEFVSQMMERMAQQTSCPCANGGPGMQGGMMGRGMMGQGMMQQQPNGAQGGMMGRGLWQQGATERGMMRQGRMGQGMQEQGRSWNFHQPMGPRFWNNTPDATPTPAQ